MPAEPDLAHWTQATGMNPVAVKFARDIPCHVKVKSDLLRVQDHDIARQTVIKGEAKLVCIDGMCCVDDAHLPPRVDSRIRAAGSLHVGSLAQQRSGRVTERSLDGLEAWLDLPAMVVSAIVGNYELDLAPSGHGDRLPEATAVVQS